jgi:hypothetical protein
MTNPQHQTRWISHLDSHAAALAHQPSITGAYQAMALAWHTAAAVGQPESPVSALGWMCLLEAIAEARDHLIAADPAAHAITYATAANPPHPFATTAAGEPEAAPAGGEDVSAGVPTAAPLDDLPQVRQAVTALIAATAAALRHLAAATDHPDHALAIAVAALTLQRTELWP